MLKRILSLILSGVLLLQVSCFYAAAESSSINENTERMSNTFKNYESDFCSAYPKNACKNTVDVNCAKRRMYRAIREAEISDNVFDDVGVGRNCETDLYSWKYDGVTELVDTFDLWINDNNKKAHKKRFIGQFIGNVKKFLNTTDEDSEIIIRKIINDSEYKKILELTEKDIKDWIKEIQAEEKKLKNKFSSNWLTGLGTVFGGGISWGATAAITGTLLAPAALPFGIAGLALGAVAGKYLGNYCGKETEESEFSEKSAEEARKHEIRLNVYSSGIEKLFHSIQRKEYEGNDLVTAQFNFNQYSPSAFIKFINLGLDTGNKDVNKIFETFSNTLSSRLMDKYNLRKEEI